MIVKQQRFPRLLYVGDVPVDATTGGSAFIYRLLQGYPPDKLRVVEGSIWSSIPERRLPDVTYEKVNLLAKRLLHSRLSSPYATYLCATAPLHTRRLNNILREFQPEAVLTVAHGFLWQTAAHVASQLGIPLHLNINDDWPRVNHLPRKMKNWGRRRFETVYRLAASRWCASPSMAEDYAKEFGVKGDVLYPLLAQNQIAFDTPKTNGSKSESCVFAYAGSIHNRAYADCLLRLAKALEPSRSKLIVYSGLSPEGARRLEFTRHNLELRPLIPPTELIPTLREVADVIFVPMSFEPGDLPNMRTAFPSKLPDCTAVGVPLLIWGPSECSAVRWARENPGVAAVISEDDPELLAEAVAQLANDPHYRLRLSTAALSVGRKYFSHEVVTREFHRALLK